MVGSWPSKASASSSSTWNPADLTSSFLVLAMPFQALNDLVSPFASHSLLYVPQRTLLVRAADHWEASHAFESVELGKAEQCFPPLFFPFAIVFNAHSPPKDLIYNLEDPSSKLPLLSQPPRSPSFLISVVRSTQIEDAYKGCLTGTKHFSHHLHHRCVRFFDSRQRS